MVTLYLFPFPCKEISRISSIFPVTSYNSCITIINIIIIIPFWEFFMPAFADGLSLESE